MIDFKGFGDWIEIFMGGKQVDKNGKEHDGDALIDEAVASFNAKEHEPPIVIGHPKDNAPAYGWVEGVKAVLKGGKKHLLMKARDVVPEFEEMVEKGLFKKRSASFYDDGRLRHVGFLGAAPPAVKGLADLKFEDSDDAVTFDFYDPQMGTLARVLRNLKNYFIEKEGKEKADAIISEWDVDYIKEESIKDKPQTDIASAFSGVMSVIDDRGDVKSQEVKMSNAFTEKFKNFLSFMGVDLSKVPDEALPVSAPEGMEGTMFSEADLKKTQKDAEEKGRKKAEAEFTESQRKERRAKQKKEISEFCDKLLKEGNLIPAWEKLGLKEFMMKLDGEEVVEFSEGSVKITPLEWFKSFMEELPKVVEFKELATKDRQFDSFAEQESVETGKRIAARVNGE